MDTDDDNDGVIDTQDNCPLVFNPNQGANDPATFGELCGGDADKDGIKDHLDNCPWVVNPNQKDGDTDGVGDVCDADLEKCP